LIALLFLKFFFESGNINKFNIGIVALILACLSKQIFFFSSIPLFLAYIYVGHYKRFSYLRLLTRIGLIGFVVFFIVHPYAFIHPYRFFEYQKSLSTSMVGGDAVSFFISAQKWFEVIKEQGVILIPVFLSPVIFLFEIYNYRKFKNFISIAIIVSTLASLITFIIVSYGNRSAYSGHYLFPLYIYLLLIISYIINSLIGSSGKIYYFRTIFVLSISVVIISSYFYNSFPRSIARLNFQNSTAFITYDYIKNNLKKGDKVAHDYKTAIPSQSGVVSCHFWQGCGDPSHLESFRPDYIIFENEGRNSGISINEYKSLIDYISINDFKLVKEINGFSSKNIFNGESIGKHDSITVYIYKRQL
jgi:hypothetical protein